MTYSDTKRLVIAYVATWWFVALVSYFWIGYITSHNSPDAFDGEWLLLWPIIALTETIVAPIVSSLVVVRRSPRVWQTSTLMPLVALGFFVVPIPFGIFVYAMTKLSKAGHRAVSFGLSVLIGACICGAVLIMNGRQSWWISIPSLTVLLTTQLALVPLTSIWIANRMKSRLKPGAGEED